MEHHQTVGRPQNGTPGWWTTVWCTSTNLKLILKQHQIFKISYFNKCYYSFEKNFLSPNISKNHQNIYKMVQNIDMWDERRDS